MISIGSKKMVDCQVGSKKVKEIYKGSTKVWAREQLSLLHSIEYTMGVDGDTNLNWEGTYSNLGLSLGDKIKIVVEILSGDNIVIKPTSIAEGKGYNSILDKKTSTYVGPFAPGDQYVQYATLEAIKSTGSYNTDYDTYTQLESNYNRPAWPNGSIIFAIRSYIYRGQYGLEFKRTNAANWVDGACSTKVRVNIYKVEP